MKHFVLAALVFTLALTAGCSLLHRKGKKAVPPELPPAAGVEAEFRDRWVSKRMHELLGSGSARTEAEARQMAAAEFAKLYPFVNSANRGAGR
ncbi:MAG: hypothetical protein PHE83_04565 [Opitutaceae bacterium]|nr:hypothetical protein [Opitutaceae bacterium]